MESLSRLRPIHPKQFRLCTEVYSDLAHLIKKKKKKNLFIFFQKDQIVMNIKIEQACFRCSVCRPNERFPTTKLKQAQSNTEGECETLLCGAGKSGPARCDDGYSRPLASASQRSLLLACGLTHWRGKFWQSTSDKKSLHGLRRQVKGRIQAFAVTL